MQDGQCTPSIGINLGTACMRVAVFDGSQYRMILDDHGNSSMPLCVAFTDSGVLVGEAARKQAQENPANTILDVTRLIGRWHSDPLVQNVMKLCPLQLRASPDGRLLVDVYWKNKSWHFTPVEIFSMILIRMKENAEQNLQATITDTVITVPAHFNYRQRQAIKEAGMIAGLNFNQIISAPAASALFYGMKRQRSKSSRTLSDKAFSIFKSENCNMIIYHDGAETLDVSLITIKENMCEVRATVGNVHLSGSDFDNTKIDNFVNCLTDMCLKDAKMGANMIHDVILAGVSTRIPLLSYYIHQYFKPKSPLNLGDKLETNTAYGAAIHAFFCSVQDKKEICCLSLQDVTPFSLCIQSTPGGMMTVCVPRNTTIPTTKEKRYRSYNNSTKFLVKFYEGEQNLTENNLLEEIELSEIRRSPQGFYFDVCFQIHTNGTLSVWAKEDSRGLWKGITINNSKIVDSGKLVWEALLYKPSESDMGITINKASTTKSLTQSGTFGKWNLVKDKLQRKHVEPEEYAIGIDFGTTYSCVAVWQQNSVRIIENEYGNRLTYSAVAFTDTGWLIGDMVHKEQVTTNPRNTVPNIKRLIGRCCSDQQVKNDRKFLPYNIVCGDKDRCRVSVQYKNEEKIFAPEEIVAMIFSKMKEIAEAHLNSKVKKAVVSVPASFNDSQRQAIKDAGVIAGLNVMQMLNEPTATAIAYFLQKVGDRSSSEKTLLIFDLGGGNLDVSILTINEGTIRVQAVVGDTKLGGEDFDNNMVCHFVEKFMKEKKRDISNKPKSLRRLRAACEKAKRVLSTNAQTVVEIDALDGGVDFRSAITRVDFEELNMSLFERSIDCVKRCLKDAKIDGSCIDEVVLVGGSTRIPKMQQLLQDFFNGKELCKSINADEAVVYGAAVQATILSGNENCKKFNISQLQDVTSQSLGSQSKDGTIMNVLIPKHTLIPAKKELLITNWLEKFPSFSLQVQECESESLTLFNISGITPESRVKYKTISVSLEVDGSGILNLMVNNTDSGENENIVISKENGGLTTEEIQIMVKSAADYKAQDEEHKARATALNSLECSAFKMKAKAKDKSLSVSSSDKKLLEDAAEKAIAWLDANPNADIVDINAWKEKLESLKSDVITKV